jgi:hypothetical protein
MISTDGFWICIGNGRGALFKMFHFKHFMGAFSKLLREAAISFVMFFHLFIRVQQLHTHWTYFRDIL